MPGSVPVPEPWPVPGPGLVPGPVPVPGPGVCVYYCNSRCGVADVLGGLLSDQAAPDCPTD